MATIRAENEAKETGTIYAKIDRRVYDEIGRIATAANVSLTRAIEHALRLYLREHAGIDIPAEPYTPLPS